MGYIIFTIALDEHKNLKVKALRKLHSTTSRPKGATREEDQTGVGDGLGLVTDPGRATINSNKPLVA